MIRIHQIKIRADILKQEEAIFRKASEMLHVRETQIQGLTIVKQSIDARKKPDIFYSYVADVDLGTGEGTGGSGKAERNLEERIVRRAKDRNICLKDDVPYRFPDCGTRKQKYPPVIIGMGPAGLFCGYFLAKAGFSPILLERGADVDSRKKDVEKFWREGALDVNSNVQFGEGGAGAFSDGKLNTLVKDKYGRNRAVLETLVKFGADPSILYEAKPHIGTDALCGIVKKMREETIRLGGKVRFRSRVTGFVFEKEDSVPEGKSMKGVVVNGEEFLSCGQAVLAVGHSARDTFEELYARQVLMEAKAFAVGLRVEHLQSMINLCQYGREDPGILGAAPYKVTARSSTGRGVYSFCMCPGGYVVNASSEPGRLAVNGMSYSARNGKNANSAIVVSVTPQDYGSDHPLAGIAFQRRLEERAYELGGGKIPVQRYGDFKACVEGRQEGLRDGKQDGRWEDGTGGNLEEESFGPITPQSKGAYAYADVSGILPKECNQAFLEGMAEFGRLIPGFDRPDALLSGVESRTSSPVRIPRDENMESFSVKGLYPCGEGAGYAGGITSAAMDGIRVAEAIAGKFRP